MITAEMVCAVRALPERVAEHPLLEIDCCGTFLLARAGQLESLCWRFGGHKCGRRRYRKWVPVSQAGSV